MAFKITLSTVQPTQLYISTQKLEQLISSYPDDFLPIPLKKLNGRIIFTDGHTRALAAHLQGHTEIAAVWDEDELDWVAYQVCVDWCLAAGIHTIANLQDQIVAPDDYQKLWLDRCQKMQNELNIKNLRLT
jgi:hypothetical protein